MTFFLNYVLFGVFLTFRLENVFVQFKSVIALTSIALGNFRLLVNTRLAISGCYLADLK